MHFCVYNISFLSQYDFVKLGLSRIIKVKYFKGEYYLYSVFRQFCFHGQHFPSINIRIVRFIKGLFQLLQLVRGEDGPLKKPKITLKYYKITLKL